MIGPSEIGVILIVAVILAVFTRVPGVAKNTGRLAQVGVKGVQKLTSLFQDRP